MTSISEWFETSFLLKSTIIFWLFVLVLECVAWIAYQRRWKLLANAPFQYRKTVNFEQIKDVAGQFKYMSDEEVYAHFYYLHYGRNPASLQAKHFKRWAYQFYDNRNDFSQAPPHVAKVLDEIYETCIKKIKNYIDSGKTLPPFFGHLEGSPILDKASLYGQGPTHKACYKSQCFGIFANFLHMVGSKILTFFGDFEFLPCPTNPNFYLRFLISRPKKPSSEPPVVFLPGLGFGNVLYVPFLMLMRSFITPNRVIIAPEWLWHGLKPWGFSKFERVPNMEEQSRAVVVFLREFYKRERNIDYEGDDAFVKSSSSNLVDNDFSHSDQERLAENRRVNAPKNGGKQKNHQKKQDQEGNNQGKKTVEGKTKIDLPTSEKGTQQKKTKSKKNITPQTPPPLTPPVNNQCVLPSESSLALATKLCPSLTSCKACTQYLLAVVKQRDAIKLHDRDGSLFPSRLLPPDLKRDQRLFSPPISTEKKHHSERVTFRSHVQSASMSGGISSIFNHSDGPVLRRRRGEERRERDKRDLFPSFSPLKTDEAAFSTASQTDDDKDEQFELQGIYSDGEQWAGELSTRSRRRRIRNRRRHTCRDCQADRLSLFSRLEDELEREQREEERGDLSVDLNTSWMGDEETNWSGDNKRVLPGEADAPVVFSGAGHEKQEACRVASSDVDATGICEENANEKALHRHHHRQPPSLSQVQFDVISHSYGTAVNGMLIREYRQHLRKVCMVDPITNLPVVTKAQFLSGMSPMDAYMLDHANVSGELRPFSHFERLREWWDTILQMMLFRVTLLIYKNTTFSEYGNIYTLCRLLDLAYCFDNKLHSKKASFFGQFGDNFLMLLAGDDVLCPTATIANHARRSIRKWGGVCRVIEGAGHGSQNEKQSWSILKNFFA